MNARQTIRAFAGLVALALIAGPSIQASATISDPGLRQTELVGTDTAAPTLSVPIDDASKSKEPLIRVAPVCASCFSFG
jgi:hypothetical protein